MPISQIFARDEEKETRRLMKLCIAGDRMFNEVLQATPGDSVPCIDEQMGDLPGGAAAVDDEGDLLGFHERPDRFEMD